MRGTEMIERRPPELETRRFDAVARLQAVAVRHFQFRSFRVERAGCRFEVAGWFTSPEALERDLEPLGYAAHLWRRRGAVYCRFLTKDAAKALDRRSVRTAIVLFFATLGTTLMAGYQFSLGLEGLNPWFGATCFSGGLIVILGLHELGHKAAAWRNGIAASPPFFIPMPPPFLLGTMGAVIKIKGRAATRKAAIELGASGPIVSFFLSIPFLWIGMKLSNQMAPLPEAASNGPPAAFIYFGESALFKAVAFLSLGPGADTKNLVMHPLMFAGWIGLFVTCLNLIPIGQLDGGHVARAVLGPTWFRRLSVVCAAGLLLLTQVSDAWWAWAVMGLLFLRLGNPGARTEGEPVGAAHIAVALFCVVMFVLTFMPNPIWIEGGAF